MAVRRLVKAPERIFFRQRVLSKNGLRMAPAALVSQGSGEILRKPAKW